MSNEQLIRAAILDVIDGSEWYFYEGCELRGQPGVTVTEAGSDNDRLNFCDAVVARIQQLRQLNDAAEAVHNGMIVDGSPSNLNQLASRMQVECELREEVSALEDERVAAEANQSEVGGE